jgi:hypothetical protein
VRVAADSTRSTKAQVAGLLLDVWCLGVKNELPPEPMSPSRLNAYRQAYFSAYEKHVQVPAELVRALVFGAAAYAHELGFDPEADFEAAATVLGEPTGPCPIRFGRNGKPFYINGPYDDPDAIVRTLRRTISDDRFHYAVAFPEQPRRRLFRSRRYPPGVPDRPTITPTGDRLAGLGYPHRERRKHIVTCEIQV